MSEEYVLILVTTPSQKEAELIGQTLVEKKLAACCNITKDIKSIFHWKGEICTEQERLLFIKSMRKNLNDIIHEVKNLHSYEVPEIIAIPIIGGSKDYLNWVKDEVW